MKLLRPILVALAMLAASLSAVALKPTKQIADEKDAIVLETSIPERLGDWVIDSSIVPVTVSPDVQAKLDALYNQTLTRTYRNSKGQRIMLSIAYGRDQSGEGSQVHRPEFCYTAQGFQVTKNIVGDLLTEYGRLAVRRLVAVKGERTEPITYWIVVGDRATLPGLGRKFSQIAYGLTGKIPDGMLIRVSTVDVEEQGAYRVEDDFVNSLLANMTAKDRLRVAGRFGA